MNLFKKILLVGGIGNAILIIYTIFNYMVGDDIKSKLNAVSDVQLPSIELIDSSVLDLLKIRETFASAMSTNEEDLLVSAQELSKEVSAKLIQVAEQSGSKEQSVQKMEEIFNAYTLSAAELTKGMMNNSLAYEDLAEKAMAMNQNYENIKDSLYQAKSHFKAKLNAGLADTHDAIDQSIIIGAVMGAICVVALLVISYLIASSAVSSIDKVTKRLKDMSSGTGDLTVQLPVTNQDEIGQLVGEFNTFINSLRQLVSDTKAVANKVAAHAHELSRLASEADTGLLTQQEEIAAVATAVTELAANSGGVLDSATKASELTTNASDQTTKTHGVVDANTRAIIALAEDVEKAASVIDNLKNETNEIGSVLGVIKGIAEQTNLLALNAAIEAARAGENGRGFAVVADEVRNLAKRTQESTLEIENMIERLQQGAEQAVGVMHQGRQQTESSVEQSHIAQQALSQIDIAVEQIDQMNTQVATSAHEQSSVAQEVSRNIEHINLLARETSGKSASTKNTSVELNSDANYLVQLVERFKT